MSGNWIFDEIAGVIFITTIVLMAVGAFLALMVKCDIESARDRILEEIRKERK